MKADRATPVVCDVCGREVGWEPEKCRSDRQYAPQRGACWQRGYERLRAEVDLLRGEQRSEESKVEAWRRRHADAKAQAEALAVLLGEARARLRLFGTCLTDAVLLDRIDAALAEGK